MQIKRILSDEERALLKANMDLSRAQRKGGGFREVMANYIALQYQSTRNNV